jgi:hypothetical protein
MLVIVPAANATCTSGAKPIFSQFGDANYYLLLPNGGFESGKASWTATGGAAVVPGNETFALAGKGDNSLSLPAGASATSSTFCITADTPLARFVMRLKSGTTGSLRLDAMIGSLAFPLGTVTSTSTAWAPSPQVRIWLTNFASLARSGEITIQLRATATSGSWLVDDFFLDPFKKR